MLALPVIVASYLFNVDSSLIGESINQRGLILPQYALSKSMIFCGYNEQLSRFRVASGLSKIDSNAWADENLTLDIIAILIHFGAWTIATFTFELLPFQKLDIISFIKEKI